MSDSGASRSSADMGQMSSQPQFSSAEVPSTKYRRKSKGKDKSRKSRKKGVEMERPIDQVDEESALTLMQMREAQIQQSRAPYYEDGHTLSAQILVEGSPTRPSTEPGRRSKSRKLNDRRGTKKQARDIYEFTSSEERSDGADRYPKLPSTPARQTDRSSPSPYHPVVAPMNALDDIPTDDDDVAAFEKYAKDTASADPPGHSDHDVYSFSQQPPNPFDQDETGEGLHDPGQLPTDVFALPQNAEKRKRKKRKRRTDDQEGKKSLAHEPCKNIPHLNPEAMDDFLDIDMSWANVFRQHEDDTMPIDPELHSMNALPPSTHLSNLNGEDPNILQDNNSGDFGTHGSLQPRKRRRLEELRGANGNGLPYLSPYSLQHDQENIQDQILPCYEDMQTQTSSGLDSSFRDNAAHNDPGFSGEVMQATRSARRKDNGKTRKIKPDKERESKRKGDKTERAVKDKAENGGAFSAAEGLQLDAFRDNYCEANNMTIWKFNELIQTPMRGNAEVKALFDEIHEILSYRPRMSVQKFCRRRFHNFIRGTWNADDDEMLKQAVVEKGKAWKEIGDRLGRMPEDCRDRWRNYHVNSEHRNREQWTDAEVVNLCSAILECMQLMKEDRMRAREAGEDVPECGTESDQEVEDMKHINWQSVSDRMGEHGGGRSRLQCSFKWGQLKKREQAEFLNAIKESRGIEKQKPKPTKNPWRMKLASKRVSNMKSGDVYALLQAVVDLDVPEEGNIPWKSLGDDQFRASWTSTDKKAAWSGLKQNVSGFETMDYRSLANAMLSRIIDDGAESLNERWDPDLHGDVSAKKPRKKRRPAKQKDNENTNEGTDPTNGYLQKSNEYVYDSDAMDGNAEDQTRLGGFEPQVYNHYDVLPMSDGMDGPLRASNGVGSVTADHQEDVFDDQRNGNGHLSMADGDVSPELAGRLHSALTAHNLSLL